MVACAFSTRSFPSLLYLCVQSTLGYGDENLAATDPRDLAKESVDAPPATTLISESHGDWATRHPHLSKLTGQAVSSSLKEGIKDLDVVEPGSEGELPA